MKNARWFAAAFLVAGLLCAMRVVRADDTAFYGEGASIYPVQSTQITLDYELLTITQNQLGSKWSLKHQLTSDVRVEALFVLRNTGKAQTITVGFPEAVEWVPEPGEEWEGTIEEFQTEIDGVPVKTVVQPLSESNQDFDFQRAYLWRMHFEAGETHTVRHTYRFKETFDTGGEWYVRYILRTGRLWAGPIGRLDVVVHCPIPVPGLRFVPYPEEFSELHVSAWEPDRDIEYGSNFDVDEAIFGRGAEDFFEENVQDGVRKVQDPQGFYRDKAVERRKLIRDYIAGLGDARLALCNKDEIQSYLNGIYATYGRPFQTAAWATFFESKWWYQPDPAYNDGRLTERDRKTVDRLVQFLQKALAAKD